MYVGIEVVSIHLKINNYYLEVKKCMAKIIILVGNHKNF